MRRPNLNTIGLLLLSLLIALAPACASARRSTKKRSVKRYHMSLRNVNTKERVNNLWVIRYDPKNKDKQWVGKRARKRLEHYLRDWKHKKTKRVPEKLLWYMYLVGYHFDAPIEIVSGYRSKERKSSRHAHAKAVDFRITGVDSKRVFEYCKRFKRVGIGYYPTSKFVHLDLRKKHYYWIDDSGPGEDSQYREGVNQRRRTNAEKKKLRAAKKRKAAKAKKRKAAKAKKRKAAKAKKRKAAKAKKRKAAKAKKREAAKAKKREAAKAKRRKAAKAKKHKAAKKKS